MDWEKRHERRKIVRQELDSLRENGYLSAKTTEEVAEAYQQFYLDLYENERINETFGAQEVSQKHEIVIKPKPAKEKKIRKTLSPDEIRERNITWSLNIGVILLLIGGLFVATSNWDTMTGLMKSGSIAAVSLLFYGIALFTRKVLHIDKTAFAFNVLGSLFLPIFILSLGWFGLLGEYLSVTGEGKNILGVLGSLLPAMVYIYFAKKLSSRLFVWFTFVSVTVGTGFLLAVFNLNVDGFYLGIMFFNALLIFFYHRNKEKEEIKLFTNELFAFTQANLVLSTLLMLFFYDNEVQNGITILLTAVIYLSMIFVTGRKEFHFVFTIMVVYGAYQLIENSILESFSAVMYALIGIGFLFIPKRIIENASLDRAFQFTSAIVSGLAFIYISLEGMLVRLEGPSLLLLIAYLIIFANFIYLSNMRPLKLFSYLGSFFGASAIFELIQLIDKWIVNVHFPIALFITGFALFIFIGLNRSIKALKVIVASSRDIAVAIMLTAIAAGVEFTQNIELGIMLLLFVLVSFLLNRLESRPIYTYSSLWTLPIFLGFSIVSFTEEINSNSVFYREGMGLPFNLAISSIIVVISSYLWRKTSHKRFSDPSFYISQILITFSIFIAIIGTVNLIWVQPLLIGVGSAMYFMLYLRIRSKWIPFLISFTVLILYFSLMQSINLQVEFSQLEYSLIGPGAGMLLLIISYFFSKRNYDLHQGFVWIGHLFFPLALSFTWVEFHPERFFSLLIGFFIYSASVYLAKKEWTIKVFLYGTFTLLFFTVESGLDHVNIMNNGLYEFPLTSAFLYLFWLVTTLDFRKRTNYYVVPFSFIGIGAEISTYPFGLVHYLLVILYTGALLYFLHRIKWEILGVIALFLGFGGTIEFTISITWSSLEKMLLAGTIGVILILIGKLLYKKLYEENHSAFHSRIDGYTINAFLFFGLMYYFEGEAVWTHAIPGLLIAASIWFQRNRINDIYSFFIPILSGIYLLEPYYSTIREINIPSLWEREIYVLPWVALSIFARQMLKGRFATQMGIIQWVILVLVSLSLIQDGLESSTIYDALILGTLSLAAMLSGMFWRIKAYFFTGAGVLLLNVILQTRPFWGNMPWWGYLFISGSILISVASYNEWHKQKAAKGESTLITILKEKILPKLREWK